MPMRRLKHLAWDGRQHIFGRRQAPAAAHLGHIQESKRPSASHLIGGVRWRLGSPASHSREKQCRIDVALADGAGVT